MTFDRTEERRGDAMYELLRTRFQQGFWTQGYPRVEATLPQEYNGRPRLDAARCPEGCQACALACPTDAITTAPALALDLGRCVFCSDCLSSCPAGAIQYTNDFRMAGTSREGLVIHADEAPRVEALGVAMRRIFGRSMRIRQVSAGDCGGCKDELNALSNVVFDISRFGLAVVASPRHADCLVVTGPIPENMRVATEKAYLAMPAPKLVVAVGACAISGGPYSDSPVCHNGVDAILPVDLYVPGCPPHPLTVLDGLLRLLDRLPKERLPRTAPERP
jgi:Ni,Fe-hydrogenase III small subunit/formate hydrogenlyase subunit 6/NADH:ubiquinone oxidoreductase subunit I